LLPEPVAHNREKDLHTNLRSLRVANQPVFAVFAEVRCEYERRIRRRGEALQVDTVRVLPHARAPHRGAVETACGVYASAAMANNPPTPPMSVAC
jgi:hypothetical protein